MKPINIYKLSRTNIDFFDTYEKHLSKRSEIKKTKLHEINSLYKLVDTLLYNGIDADGVNNFYFQYEIPQIGKEFDLLRISNDLVINIELKSRDVGVERIQKQLKQNKSYLSHLSRKIDLFTYVSSTKKFYFLEPNGSLSTIDGKKVVDIIHHQKDCFDEDINKLFKVSDFLVSPFNTCNKFVNREYFLTPQQEENKKQIIEALENDSYDFFGMTGGPGTGKTLALYDIAYQLSQKCKVCVIHCGMLCSGHVELARLLRNIDIFSARDFKMIDFSRYKYILVDESHRFYTSQFKELVNKAIEYGIKCFFAYDQKQVLSRTEVRRNIVAEIQALDGFCEFSLSNKIRTNKEVASFIRRLLNIYHTDVQPLYPSVSVVYANNTEEAKYFIKELEDEGYVFINYTKSRYYKGSFDDYYSYNNTHEVIGQEFDNVLMIIDDTFYYSDSGKLMAKEHPNPDYLYSKLLFQGLTRVREKLAIIVIANEDVFEKILNIIC